jgi:hypothetical protein
VTVPPLVDAALFRAAHAQLEENRSVRVRGDAGRAVSSRDSPAARGADMPTTARRSAN